MASRKRKPAAPPLDDQRLQVELGVLRQRLAVERATKLSGLKPKVLRDRLVAALVAEGFEATASWIRRPLKEQLAQALEHGATLARKELSVHVRGASPVELQKLLSEAEQAGLLKRILRGKVEAWAGSAAAVLSPQELTRLKANVSALDKALGQVIRRRGVTLLASDVQEALEQSAELVRKSLAASRGGGDKAKPMNGQLQPGGTPLARAAQHSAPDEESTLRSTLAALGAVRDASTGLSYVPDVVRRLLPGVPAAVAQNMLLLAERRELLELRPEGGLGRLTTEELELCPPGPAGTRLSWARLLQSERT